MITNNSTLQELFDAACLSADTLVQTDEHFSVADLFSGIEWSRISEALKAELESMFFAYVTGEAKDIAPSGKPRENQQIYLKLYVPSEHEGENTPCDFNALIDKAKSTPVCESYSAHSSEPAESDQYSLWVKQCLMNLMDGNSDTDPLRRHCGQAEYVQYSTYKRFFQDDIILGRLSISELKEEVESLNYHLDKILSEVSLHNEQGRYIYYISMLFAAEAAFWNGEFTKSISCFTVVLDEWADGFENHECITYVLGSIFSLLGLMGLNEYIDAYCKRYSHLIRCACSAFNERIVTHENDDSRLDKKYNFRMCIHYRRLMRVYRDRYHLNLMVSHPTYNSMSEYDKSVQMMDGDPYTGKRRISGHPYFFETDEAHNSLSLFEETWNLSINFLTRKSGITIIKDLQSVIDRERELFLHLAAGPK